MLMLKTISTGSIGNCYALMVDNQILLIDLGIDALKIKKQINYRVSDVGGCIVSHKHL